MKTNVKQILVESLLLETSDLQGDVARLSRRLHARRELWRNAACEREQLRKENTRLRAELALIRSIAPADTYTGKCQTCIAMRDTARLALEVTL